MTDLGVQSATHFMEASDCLNTQQLVYFLYLEHNNALINTLYISMSASNNRLQNPQNEGKVFSFM